MNPTLTHRGYTAQMAFDADDKLIVGRVLGIDDIITFHGESVREFERHFHAAVDDYIAACAKLGSAPEKPASGRLMLRVSPQVHAAALKAASRHGVSLNKWAEQALGEASRKVAGGKRAATASASAGGGTPRSRSASRRNRASTT
jgi:predicted HicB family RNase H-like nuclease